MQLMTDGMQIDGVMSQVGRSIHRSSSGEASSWEDGESERATRVRIDSSEKLW